MRKILLLLFGLLLIASCGCGEEKIEEYHDNGQLASVGTARKNFIYGKWQLHGLLKNFDKFGNLVSEENYVEGKLHGWCKNYFSNGKIESRGVFKH
ncbi:MAG: hypothetical protein KGZ81_05515 [Flavobacteriales bacterium]|nr:hypothetical protein [Flavobacteriales bacterium]MBS4040040.1 hypothetical protein [Flavobacteriales bacterium]